jgi:hypothetical protein
MFLLVAVVAAASATPLIEGFNDKGEFFVRTGANNEFVSAPTSNCSVIASPIPKNSELRAACTDTAKLTIAGRF